MAQHAYVYALIDPRNNTYCYVGKTSGEPRRRMQGHFHSVRRGEIGRKADWIRELISIGLAPILRILVHCENEAEAFRIEIALITIWRAKLLNTTIGGQGASGAVRSPETLAKMSIAGKGKPFTEAEKQARAALWTQERRAAMSAKQKGKPKSAAHKAACSVWQKGIPKSVEHKTKVSLALKGKPRSEACKAAQRAAWTPEKRAAFSARRKGLPRGGSR